MYLEAIWRARPSAMGISGSIPSARSAVWSVFSVTGTLSGNLYKPRPSCLVPFLTQMYTWHHLCPSHSAACFLLYWKILLRKRSVCLEQITPLSSHIHLWILLLLAPSSDWNPFKFEGLLHTSTQGVPQNICSFIWWDPTTRRSHGQSILGFEANFACLISGRRWLSSQITDEPRGHIFVWKAQEQVVVFLIYSLILGTFNTKYWRVSSLALISSQFPRFYIPLDVCMWSFRQREK